MAMKRTDVQQGVDFPVEETKIDEVTFETASRKQNHTLLEKDHARKALVTVYSAEPKISVMVAPMYADYFGKVMHVMINGISIAVPCNGKPYDIPETFAAEVFRRLRAINEQQQRQKRYSDVSSNVENAPGELALF